ncbi:MAG: hypothetical protein AAGF78_15040 [Pseudomonadota bacterium]
MTAKPDLAARLFEIGNAAVPKLLTLQDRNPHSSSYGCFDRAWWHLRIKDFPSGMAQEFVLPLALAYRHNFAGNTLHQAPALRDWIEAGIRFAARSAHRDGSCDDYYPFEKAAGATAFSLYAMVEAIPLAALDPEPHLPFLVRRGRWLAGHMESGQLSNHEALTANTLFRLAELADDAGLAEAAQRRLERALSWQTEEGWFREYQGCDPGYLTLTLANLAEIDAKRPSAEVRAAIERGVDFLAELQPPDGWMGGEWTSRNTNNHFPHGLALIGTWLPKAQQVNARAVAAMDPAPEWGDDHIIAHHSWSCLKAALIWSDEPERAPPGGTRAHSHFPEAGLVLTRQGAWALLCATKKGGAYRLYHGDKLIRSDTGLSVIRREGKKDINLVAHLWAEPSELTVEPGQVALGGVMGRAKAQQMTSFKQIVLRVLMLTLGRLKPDLVRQILQRLLITGGPKGDLRFERRLSLSPDGLRAEDVLVGPGEIAEVGIGPAQTSIYTVMSRVYHPPQLQPWEDLGEHLRPGSGERLRVERRFGAPEP